MTKLILKTILACSIASNIVLYLTVGNLTQHLEKMNEEVRRCHVPSIQQPIRITKSTA